MIVCRAASTQFTTGFGSLVWPDWNDVTVDFVFSLHEIVISINLKFESNLTRVQSKKRFQLILTVKVPACF